MSEGVPTPRGSPAWVWGLLVALEMLYMASVGPVLGLAVPQIRGISPFEDALKWRRLLRLPYAPLFRLAEESDCVGNALNWYVRWYAPTEESFCPTPPQITALSRSHLKDQSSSPPS